MLLVSGARGERSGSRDAEEASLVVLGTVAIVRDNVHRRVRRPNILLALERQMKLLGYL